jgi:hypothetical protein
MSHKTLNVRWPDAHVSRVELDYDNATIHLEESAAGTSVMVRCIGFVSFEVPALWDEMIVESASVSDSSPRIDKTLAEVAERNGGTPPRPSGSPARNLFTWWLLDLNFIDGSSWHCVAHDFEVVRPDV